METTEEEVEELQLQIEEVLLTQKLEIITKLAQGLGIEETEWKDKRRIQIISTLRKYIEGRKEGEEDQTKRKEELMKITKAIELVMETEDVKEKKKEMKDDSTKKKDEELLAETSLDKSFTQMTINKLNNMNKKEFSISGKIGDTTNEKDVGYLGVMRQMQEGEERGYKEKEIITGVLRAIVPKSLKTYLGITPKLDITKLSQILRIHYQEKSATELYQELITMKQTINEEPIAFVVRAFETREKILVASKEENEVTYDHKQVQKLCMSTIESGVNRDIAMIIRPYLNQTKEISDVELMGEVHRAEASLQLRSQKEKEKKTVRISTVAAPEMESEILKAIKGLESKMSTMDDLKKEVGDLREQVTYLKKKPHQEAGAQVDIQEKQTQDTRRMTRNYYYKKCLTCHTKNVECWHCYRCGGEGHYARECRQTAENAQRLSWRGTR